MLTIKYIWLVAIIAASGFAGASATYVLIPTGTAIEKNCDESRNTFKRAPVVESPSRGF